MKVALIIPLYKQSMYWHRLLSGIQKQSLKPTIVYIVVDRPSDDLGALDSTGKPINAKWNALGEISKLNASIHDIDIKLIVIDKVPSGVQRTKAASPVFLAGYARNLGIEHAVKDGCDIFVFMDGDCIPQDDFIKSHVELCSTKLPMMSIGRRRESKLRWMDQREVSSNLTHLRLFDKMGSLINNPDLLKQCLIVWSCNVAMNLSAIKLIYKFNETYYQRTEIFNNAFNGVWGGEDSFLGITAWYCRVFMHTLGNIKSGVEHIDHQRPESIYNKEHKIFFDTQCEMLRKKLVLNPINLNLLDYT
jgi:glycosyltransferase involved in cell wall biosynthesis